MMKFVCKNILLDRSKSHEKSIKPLYSISIRGVSDVGFPIFADADTDADFAF